MLQVNNLVGFGAGGGAAAAPTIFTAPTVVGHTFDDDDTVVLPTGLTSGDLLCVHTAGLSAANVPSGWTQILFTSNTHLLFKISDGTESGSTIDTGTKSGSCRNHCIAFNFSGGPVASATAQDADAEKTSGTPTNQVKNCGSYIKPMLVVGCYTSTSAPTTSFTGMTEDGNSLVNSNTLEMRWRLIETGDTASNITVGMNDTGFNNSLASFILELA